MEENYQNEELYIKIEKLILDNDITGLRTLATNQYPQDIAEALGHLDDNLIILALRMFTTEVSSEIFPFLDNEIQEAIITKWSSKQVKELFDELYTDDIVDILEEMPSNIVKKILRAATPESRLQINEILKYNDETAGSIMNVDYTRLREDWTITEAIEKIRAKNEINEHQSTFYVVDHRNSLKGVLELKDLIFSKGEDFVKDVMDARVVYSHTKDDQEVVIDLFKKYDITTLPIINSQQKLVGIVTVDDIIDVIEEEATEDIHKMAGISSIENEYFKTSIWKMIKSRSFWLLFLMISATLTQVIISIFMKIYLPSSGTQIKDGDWSITYIMTMLLTPLLTVISGAAGHAGSQTSTMVVRALSLKEVEAKDFAKVLWKELRVAFIIGLILVSINFLRMLIIYSIEYQGNLHHKELWFSIATLSIAMFLALIFSKLIGGILPILAKKMKIDPTIMAGPLLTTLVDALATALFFSIGLIFFL